MTSGTPIAPPEALAPSGHRYPRLAYGCPECGHGLPGKNPR